MVEPPGIFRGRGEHPLAGVLKSRIMPENVTLNIGYENPVPRCDIAGHCWKDIVTNQEATWLAFYKDEKKDKSSKYVFLAANSKFKGISDMKKYEKARKLKESIDSIRDNYRQKLADKDDENKQLGVAAYLIDYLALRVGNEKNDDEADTVGCCSLRVEHISFLENNQIIFDFLGKDSMRYHNTVTVEPTVYTNLKAFVRGKKPSDDLFDLINASKLNDYLKLLMPDLSAKVFRTFNASVTLQKELEKENLEETSVEQKVIYYNKANKDVAILCNHQKTIPKTFNETSDKLQQNLKDMLEYLKELQEHVESFGAKKSKKKEKAVLKKSDEKVEMKGKLKKVFPPTLDKSEKTIEGLKGKIDKLSTKIQEREDSKQIALGTSKLNYMDPRISVTWCKNNEVPIEKIFAKSIREKFPWAMYSDTQYKF